MIDFETLEFISKLNDLVRCASNGIEPFSRANETNRYDCVFYDATELLDGNKYRIVGDTCTNEIHHDIVSYWDERCEYEAFVFIEEDGSKNIQIYFPHWDSWIIVDDANSRWYVT